MDLVLRPRGIPLHRANLLTEFIRSNRAKQLLANHRLRLPLNSRSSCRKLSRSNSDSAVRCGGPPAQL
jgi:hypothetical protein